MLSSWYHTVCPLIDSIHYPHNTVYAMYSIRDAVLQICEQKGSF
jgi:hypothetical protein